MPSAVRHKPGSLKDPEVAQLFSTKDPEQRYYDLREVGSGSFGSVFYVSAFSPVFFCCLGSTFASLDTLRVSQGFRFCCSQV